MHGRLCMAISDQKVENILIRSRETSATTKIYSTCGAKSLVLKEYSRHEDTDEAHLIVRLIQHGDIPSS
jgi:tagatose-1,6-bisphosphate aldolase non-catalytic subunit AgaZ/GatZ